MTTFENVRNQQVSNLEALVPTNMAGTKFRRHRDEVDFFDWCTANKAACFRRFDLRGGVAFTGPEITNTDVEFHRTMSVVTVAYPMEWGKYGLKNRASLEKLMEEDIHQIDDTIGLRGMANWAAGSWSQKTGEGEIAEQDGVMYLRIQYEVGFYRSV